MALSNSEIASALGLSHSGVSRMRSGARVASVDTLQKLVTLYDADPRALLQAAAKAADGDAEPWRALLRELFGDEEPDAESA